jgi:hypothetical protein
MPRKHSNLSVARIGRAERAGQALDLRKAGLTFREIGDRMGVTEQRAHKIVTQELARLNGKRTESAEAVTRLEIERLNALMSAVWEKAKAGDLAAIDRVLAIMLRRARLLGIDAEKQPPPAGEMTLNVIEMIVTDGEIAHGNAVLDNREAPSGTAALPQK